MKYRRLLFIAALFLFASHAVLIALLELEHEHEKCLEIDKGYLYINIQHETNPMELSDATSTIENFKLLHSLLEESDYCYYEIYNQPLFNIATNNTDLFEQVGSVQISLNALTSFESKISSGRSFVEKDYFFYNGDRIPAILGSNFKNRLELGDAFNADYLFSTLEFEVVGFWDNNSFIETSMFHINLDDIVVIPSFEFANVPVSEEEYVTQKIHYANKTSGKIKVLQEKFLDACQFVKNLLEKSKVGSYSISFSTFKSALLNKGYSLEIFIFIVLSIFLCSILILLSLNKKFLKDCASFRELIKKFVVTVCLAYFCSTFLSTLLLAQFGFNPKFLIKQIPIVLVVIVLIGIDFILLKNRSKYIFIINSSEH